MFLSNGITCFFLFYHLNQYLGKICPTWNKETRQIVLSTGHAIFTSGLSTVYLMNIISEVSYINLTAISFGFTLYDIEKIITIRNRVWKQMLLHHSLIIASLCPLVYYGFTNQLIFEVYPYFVGMNYLVEYATIPLNIGWHYHENNKTNTIMFKMASILTLILYLPFRVLNTFYLSILGIFYMDHIPPLQEIQVLFCIMNMIWFYKLCKKAVLLKKTIKDE